jgi:hypothetical protein
MEKGEYAIPAGKSSIPGFLRRKRKRRRAQGGPSCHAILISRLFRREALFFLLSKRYDAYESVLPVDQQVKNLLRFLGLMILL